MTRQKLKHATVSHDDVGIEQTAKNRKLTAIQLEQWSDLIAQGEIPFPTDLTAEDFERLLAGVARRRQRRLVKFIASAIAQDIARSRRP